VLRFAGEIAYRTGLGPEPSDVPDRRLVEVAGGPAPIAMSAEELRRRFGSWELVRELPVSGPEMQSYVRGPAPIRAALRWGWFEPRRFELQRT